MSEPLTDAELADVLAGANYRTATCIACGRTVNVEERARLFSCACVYKRTYDAAPTAFDHVAPIQTPTGPTLHERLVAEVRRLREFTQAIEQHGLLLAHLGGSWLAAAGFGGSYGENWIDDSISGPVEGDTPQAAVKNYLARSKR